MMFSMNLADPDQRI